jgi:hypothetical protein
MYTSRERHALWTAFARVSSFVGMQTLSSMVYWVFVVVGAFAELGVEENRRVETDFEYEECATGSPESR